MASEFVIELRDHAGAPLRVSAAGLHGDSGSLELAAIDDGARWSGDCSALAPGRTQLRVDLADRPPLRLRLLVARDGERLRFSFAGKAPRCCSLSSDDQRSRLAVTLGPSHAELIFVAGWDYSGGADHQRWSQTWRDDLYAGETRIGGDRSTIAKLIHDHTVVTLFDFKTGLRTQQLRADGGWHDCDETLQGSVPTHLGRYRDADASARRHADDSISITHVYRHIIELGRQSPGSLVAWHVFSHAWAGGPILVNTDEAPRYAYAPTRDPGDKDGRLKDFSPTNMPERERFAAAFAPGAEAKLWGCYSTTLYRRMARAAARAGDPDTPLTVRAGEHVRTLSANAIIAEFRERIIGDSYMARLGRAAGITVYGAPPGMGSSFQRIGRRRYMYVKRDVFALEYRWYAEALGLQPDISGHFAYTRAQQLGEAS